MNRKLTIALVAHDNRKADMVEWAVHNAEFLSHHLLVCTGTTGGLIRNAFDEKGIAAEVICMHSGPLGGDAEIAAMVVHVADLRTCVLHPASTTHRQMNEQELAEAGVSSDLIRMSIGIEDIDDLLEDIQQALAKV